MSTRNPKAEVERISNHFLDDIYEIMAEREIEADEVESLLGWRPGKLSKMMDGDRGVSLYDIAQISIVLDCEYYGSVEPLGEQVC